MSRQRPISLIVIHCAASTNGKPLGNGTHTAADTIDRWHIQRGFQRQPAARAAFNPNLSAIGYHFVLDTDGTKGTGRTIAEVGAHVQGFNSQSISICLVGTSRFTRAQWDALHSLVKTLKAQYPAARVVGHRDLSPDADGDGTVEPHEWLKTCPGFNVVDWLAGGMQPLAGHIQE